MGKRHKDKRYSKRQRRRYSYRELGIDSSWNPFPSINDENCPYGVRADPDMEIEESKERRLEELVAQYSLLEKLWKNRDGRKSKSVVRRVQDFR